MHIPKELFHQQLLKLLTPNTTDQTHSGFHWHADNLLREWDGYEKPDLAARLNLMELLPNGNLRNMRTTPEEMATIVIALKWSLQNIEDFELKGAETE